ncbi:MAG: small conductance mechanosensitive channel [Halobacteriales archaeon]|jgi:small conductance mechanosensitive channel
MVAAGTTTSGNGTSGGDGDLTAPVREALREFLDFVPPGFETAVAILVVIVVGWYLSKLVVRLAGRTVARRIQRPSVTRTVLRGIRLSILVFAGFVVIGLLGLQPGDIFLSVTVFSAVLGIILAPVAGSIINGLFVLADQPYEIGDMIEITDSGQRGFVEDITIRYTKIFTLDNTFIVIPNSSIRERDVVNYSAEDERTRLSLQLLVTYEGDLEKARRIMEDAAREVDEVISGGPDIRIGSARYVAGPTAYIDEYADHGVLLTLRYWVKHPYKMLVVRSAVNERVWTALQEADDVEIAYPHQHLVFDETSGTAAVALQDRDSGPAGGRSGKSPGAETSGDDPGAGGPAESNTGPDGPT